MSARVVATFTTEFGDEEVEITEVDAAGGLPSHRSVKVTDASGGKHVIVLSEDDASAMAVALLTANPLRRVYRLGFKLGCEESNSVDHHNDQEVHPGEDDAVRVAMYEAKPR